MLRLALSFIAPLFFLGCLTPPCTAQVTDFLNAARTGDLPTLQKLSTDTALMTAHGARGRTALHEAAANCHIDAARFLVEYGADRRAVDDSSLTPMDLASQCPLDIRPFFSVLFAPAEQERMPWSLPDAIRHRQTQIISMLVTLGVNVNAPAADGNRPLNIASLNGDAATARILLEHGADPNLRSSSGMTPLHDAASQGNADVVDLLLAHDAKVDARAPDDGSTPLHYAASLDRLDVVKALVIRGADVTLKTANGMTPADLARKNKFTDIEVFLAEHQTAH
jgi:ankyrin repeat protein